MSRLDLWPRPYWPRAFGGRVMRLRDDIRQCVAFIGISNGLEDFTPAGTAFFVGHGNARYAVTAKHVAEALGDTPFAFRVNKGGKIGVIDAHYDPVEHGADFPWMMHEDRNVDLAVMDFNIDWTKYKGDVRCIPTEMFLRDFEEENAGVGDLCYAVGLFRLMRGKMRNLPFVHTGHIGCLPGDEKIPVRNWRVGPDEPKTVHVDGYLVEMMSLDGLSGAPVFVRPTVDFIGLPTNKGDSVNARLPVADVKLLGVWQSAWWGDPDDVMQLDGKGKVPVGIGSVVPVARLLEILESPICVERRKAFRERVEAAKASQPEVSSSS